MSEKYKITNPNGMYFFTMTVVDWVPACADRDVFTRKIYSDTMLDSIRFCQKDKGLIVHAYVIMPSHVHMIASAQNGYDLSATIRDMKKFTSQTIVKQIQNENESRKEWMLYRFEYAGKFLNRIKNYKFWQDGNQPKECFSMEFLKQKVEYIHFNPCLTDRQAVEAGIVYEPWQYVYSSAGDYAGIKGLIDLVMIDFY